MFRGRITKNDGKWVYILTENQESIVAKRTDIDFGILVGDSVFIDSQSGVLVFRKIEKTDILNDGDPYFFDSQWQDREAEHKASVVDFYNSELEVYKEELQKEEEELNKYVEEVVKETTNSINAFVMVVIMLFILIALIIIF